MEKDIEYRIKRFLDECEDGNWYWDDGVDAIENLIKGYRKLEEKNKKLFDCYNDRVGEIIDLENKIEEQEAQYDKLAKHFVENHIPKSKIKEKINAYSKSCAVVDAFIVDVLQELMEDK